MIKIATVQSRVDKVLSSFSKMIKELDASINKLEVERTRTQEQIKTMNEWNAVAGLKIDEYKKIKSNIEGIMK